jgi:hypothetical protein
VRRTEARPRECSLLKSGPSDPSPKPILSSDTPPRLISRHPSQVDFGGPLKSDGSWAYGSIDRRRRTESARNAG